MCYLNISLQLLSEAVKLNVFDHIQQHDNACVTVDKFAEDHGLNAQKLERFFNALVSVEALSKATGTGRLRQLYITTDQ